MSASSYAQAKAGPAVANETREGNFSTTIRLMKLFQPPKFNQESS